jgi:RNA polymerase sigma factor (sigma-70 family)
LFKGETPQADPGPDAAVTAELERERVRAALDRLTPRDREVLLLWDAGQSYDEIAAHTGLAKGAIGTTLARARQRLVEAYDAGSEGEHVAHR